MFRIFHWTHFIDTFHLKRLAISPWNAGMVNGVLGIKRYEMGGVLG